MSQAAINGTRMDPETARELLGHLERPLPSIPSRYLYDDLGSGLYEQITMVPEYYQTRTELHILDTQAEQIVADASPIRFAELGSGAGRKIGTLVEAAQRRHGCVGLELLDINASFLQDSVDVLQARYPGLEVRGVVGQFTADLHRFGAGGRRMICFFGGTIGNFHPDQTVPFLTRLAAITGPTDSLLIGFDLEKDPSILEAAYNDAQGVTAAFNRNILRVFNQGTGADFEPTAFEHVAFYDADRAWIEMRLRATRATSVSIPALGWERHFAPGDEVRTEISCKYTRDRVAEYASDAGLALQGWYTDEGERFALGLLVPQ